MTQGVLKLYFLTEFISSPCPCFCISSLEVKGQVPWYAVMVSERPSASPGQGGLDTGG